MSKEPANYRLRQRNKYLDDIGLDPWDYGINWGDDSDKERKKTWKRQRKDYGFDERECYCVYNIYAEWLYSHLMMYREKASRSVDLTYHTIEFEGKTYTQIEATDKIIKWIRYFLKNQSDMDKEERSIEKLQKATRLWSELLPYTWW